MTKAEFLAALSGQLDFMTGEERAITLDFYAGRIDARLAAGVGEAAAVAEAGTPQEIAARLQRERAADANAAVIAPPAVPAQRRRARRAGIGAIIAFAVAAILVAAGRIASALLSPGASGTRTAAVSEAFNILEVNAHSAAVELLPAPDGRCRAEYAGNDDAVLTAEVRGNVLYVAVDESGGVPVHLSLEAERLTIYLPEAEYDAIHVMTSSGGVTARELSAQDLALNTTSGAISLSDARCRALTLSSTSGRIDALRVQADEAASAKTTSGGIYLEALCCDALSAESSSGALRLADTLAQAEISLKSTSGAIDLAACDAPALSIRASSGRVAGTLLTPKSFDARSTSGSIDLPRDDASGGTCRVSTTSGSICLSIED